MISAKMKKTEIGMIPEDWYVVKVGEISDTYAGGTPLRSNKEYYGGNIRWVKSGEVNLGEIFDTKEKITESGLKNSSAKHIPENTVLVAMYGATAGKVGILRVNGTANQAVLAVPNNRNKFNYRFMYYLLSSKTNKLVNSTQGTGQPNLSKFLVDNLEIQLPSIIEQDSIAEVLSTIDKRLDIVERESQRVERLKVGLMKELFEGNWTKVKIKDVVKDIKNGFASGKRDEKGIVQIRMNNVTTDGRLIFDSYLKVPTPANIENYSLKKNDFLFNNTNSIDLVGKSTIYYESKFPCTFSNHFTRIRFDESKVVPEFVLYYTILLWRKNYFKSVAIRHVGQAAVNPKYLLDVDLPYPPIEEQRKIVQILMTLDKKLSLQQSKKSKLENIKKSLMNDLLTGKKRVKL